MLNLPPAFNSFVCCLLCCQNLFDGRIRNNLMMFHCVGNYIIDIEETDLPVQELAHSPLIGRVEDRWHAAAVFAA